MPTFMDYLLLVVFFVGFILNLVFLRIFLKKLSDKLNFLIEMRDQPQRITSMPLSTNGLQKNPLFAKPQMPDYDSPTPNQITDEEEGLELNEQNFSSLPKDIKIQIEGGDSQTPPGFDVTGTTK